MTWVELIDRHWAPCYALALFTVFWVPLAAVAAMRRAREQGKQ